MKVLEDADAVAPAWARPSVRPAPTGQIALGDDRQPSRRQRDAVVQRGDRDATARLGEVGGLAVDDRQVDAVVEHDLAQAGRRAGAVGGDDDAVTRPTAAGRDGEPARSRRRRTDPSRTIRRSACPATPEPSRSPRTRRDRRRAGGPVRRAGGGTRGHGRGPTSTPGRRRGRPPRRAGRRHDHGCAAVRRARPWPSPAARR